MFFVNYVQNLRYFLCIIAVAPLVGAWIEIVNQDYIDKASESLPLWERGLKSDISVLKLVDSRSLPLWERGLKS